MSGIILVGVDNTNTALGAAKKAAQLAVVLDAELHVVSAYNAKDVGLPRLKPAFGSEQVATALDEHRGAVDELRQGAQSAADSVVETLRKEQPALRVQGRAIEGIPGAAIVRESKDLDAEFVVVGNRNVQGVSRILGSIASAVARDIDCDLYIVNTRKK